jgi:pimeloyl-ACP methyl ester carboxylesterase
MKRVALATGVELDVLDTGPHDVPALIFLHGFPESHETWRHQIFQIVIAALHLTSGAIGAHPNRRMYKPIHLTSWPVTCSRWPTRSGSISLP